MENLEYIPAQEFDGGRSLPIYKGYTVDYRLKEFRKFDDDGWLAWFPFHDEFGDELLAEMIAKRLVPDDVLAELV